MPKAANVVVSVSQASASAHFKQCSLAPTTLVNQDLLHQLIDPILQAIRDSVASWGYFGVVFMMAIESANIPLPSEAIMPTAGILVQQNKMTFISPLFPERSVVFLGRYLRIFLDSTAAAHF